MRIIKEKIDLDVNADFDLHTFRVCAVTSWKTGTPDYVQSLKLIITAVMNGNDDYNNTLPGPVYPNAKTAKEMFSKDYTKDQMF